MSTPDGRPEPEPSHPPQPPPAEPAVGPAAAAAGPVAAAGSPAEAGAAGSAEIQSGLRNPAAAVRGVGAGALVIEALILLLAIVPLTKLDTRATGWAIATVLTLCGLCLLLAGLLRYRFAWYAGGVLQLLVGLCGGFHLMLLALGIVFGAVWAYVLSVRHSVLGTW